MPRSLGTYTLPPTSWSPAVNGNPATTADWNTVAADLSSGITGSMARDGSAPPTANLAMNNFKLTGLAVGSATTDSAQYGQLLGWGQTAQSPARVINSDFTNSTGRPIFVAATFLSSGPGTSTCILFVGGAQLCVANATQTSTGMVCGVVPPNSTIYRVAHTGGTGPTLISWYELRS